MRNARQTRTLIPLIAIVILTVVVGANLFASTTNPRLVNSQALQPAQTSTQSPTPQPPTPQPTSEFQGEISATVLNVRSGPSTNNEIIGSLSLSETVDIYARNEDGTWWYVCCISGTDIPGWVSAQFVTPNFDIEQTQALLPLHQTQLTPTPTQTITPTLTSVMTATLPSRPAAQLDPADRNGLYDAAPAMMIDVNNTYIATMQTEKGDIRIRLFAEQAPVTVNNFVFLARQGFYDNTTFHRVLNNFMAQGGDPTGTGAGGPGYRFEDEFTDELRFERAGLLAMANSGVNTNGSQFFITFVPTPHLNDLHTIFGEVIEGIEVLDLLTRRDPNQSPDFEGDTLIFVGIEESTSAQEMTPTATQTSIITSTATFTPVPTIPPTLTPTSPNCPGAPNLLVTTSAPSVQVGDVITVFAQTDGGFGLPQITWRIEDKNGDEQAQPIFESLQENGLRPGGGSVDIALQFRALMTGTAVIDVAANGEVSVESGGMCAFSFTTISGRTEPIQVVNETVATTLTPQPTLPVSTNTPTPTAVPECAGPPDLLVTTSASTLYAGDMVTVSIQTPGGFGIPTISWAIEDENGEAQTEPIFEALQDNDLQPGGSFTSMDLQFRALTPGTAHFGFSLHGEVVPSEPGTMCPFYFTTITNTSETVRILDAPSLPNADYECTDGYYEQVDARSETVYIPNNWTLVTSNGTPVINSTRTFFAKSCDGSAHVERISGIDSIVVRAQDLETPPEPGKSFDVSFYHQHPAVVGVDYSASGWALSLCGGSNVPSDCPEDVYIAKMIGIDPTGGTDPLAESVIWAENRDNFVTADDERIGWANIRTSAKAEATAVTVFMRLNSPFQWHGNHGFLDAASLVRAPTASLNALPTCVDGTDLDLSWTTVASADIAAIPAGTYQNLVDVQVRDNADSAWRDVVSGFVGDGSNTFVAETIDRFYEFRIRARAEQPPAPPEGASPNQRYPGVWSEPISVFFRDPTTIDTPAADVTPQPFPEADFYLFLPMVERQETIRPACE